MKLNEFPRTKLQTLTIPYSGVKLINLYICTELVLEQNGTLLTEHLYVQVRDAQKKKHSIMLLQLITKDV